MAPAALPGNDRRCRDWSRGCPPAPPGHEVGSSLRMTEALHAKTPGIALRAAWLLLSLALAGGAVPAALAQAAPAPAPAPAPAAPHQSAARSGGTEGVRTCSPLWSPGQ